MDECPHTHRIGAYVDGEVPPDERERLDRHVAACPACARELERLRALRRFLAVAEAGEVPPDVLSRLHCTVSELPARGLVRLATRLTLAAAAVLAISVGWLLHAQSARPSAPGRQPVWAKAAVTLSFNGEAETSREAQLARWMTEGLSSESTQ
jgi:anti-sigma factor RsiW